ncbi:MAG: integrase, partial [Archaeoglobaceae archaeon]|nr:integrase [Archaeoglobaceae archaeon]MDW8127922.1 integrase [Archaeoglobaceae archaeon]
MRRPGFEPGAGARQAIKTEKALDTEEELSDLRSIVIEDFKENYDFIIENGLSVNSIKKLRDEKKLQGFLKYMFSKETEAEYIMKMISAMHRLLPENIMYPEDFEDIEATKYLIRFLQNFFTYLEKKGIEKINGLSLKAWRSAIPKEKKGIEEVYPSDQDVIDAFNKCPENLKPYYKLIMYSGVRLKQILRALETFDEKKLVIDGNVGRYPLGYISKGKKLGYWLFFPAKFADELLRLSKSEIYSYEWLIKSLSIDKITPKRLRKWHANFLIRNDISPDIVNF